MKKFEVGAMYWDTSAVDHNDVMVIKITRRTEKSVWFVRMRGDQPEGEPSRTKIFMNATYEHIMPYRYSMAPVWDADRKVEPEAPANDEPQEAANDAPETADENKAAAMTAQEETARKMIAEQTTEYLLKTWESTTANNDPFIPTVRGWLMDELQSRYPEAYDAWLDSEVCEDATLRGYIEAAERATQDSLEAETDAPAEANAPEPDEVYDRMETVRRMGGFLNKFLDEGDSIAAHGMKSDIDWALSVGEEYGVALEVEYDADGRFVDVCERKAQADAPADDDSAAAGRPAPQETAPSVYATRNPVAPYDIFRYHPESGTYLFENEGEAALIDALNFHADSGNALSVVNALYEITHDGGGWFSPRNHPVMLDALNDYISFLTKEIEIYDNFPNEMEKEIAVGKRAEAIAIRNAFAISADAAARAAETETIELHDTVDVYRVCEEAGIAWTRVNADTLAIRAEDYRKLLDGAKNKRYIRNLRRDTGRFCGGAFTLAG